jgi:hypothetical protein
MFEFITDLYMPPTLSFAEAHLVDEDAIIRPLGKLDHAFADDVAGITGALTVAIGCCSS